jgi:uncharacterized protein (TIGR00255 family)
MRSMTGHGRGVAERGGRRATVEVRSVNHRFFDLKLRSGPLDPALEERIGNAVRKRAERGAFTVTVRDDATGAAGGVRVDVALARGVAAALEQLRQAVGSSEPVSLALIAAQPGVLQVADQSGDTEAVVAALEGALEELVGMRRREGQALERDLRARLGRLGALSVEIAQLTANAPEEHRKRLAERLHRLLSAAGGGAAAAGTAVTVDEQRLAQEVALLADRMDVTEELVRLRSHLAQAEVLLGEDAPVGRRLDFLVQELGREVNTIGSKSQSAEIARRVVEAKAELEKIREQVQNVE